jgi:hypothetical protein
MIAAYSQKLMATARTRERAEEPLFLWGAVAFFGVCALFYGYFVNQAVFAAAERGIVHSETSRIAGQVAVLEFEYNTLRAGVTLEQAAEKGFSAPLSISYADRKSRGLVRAF